MSTETKFIEIRDEGTHVAAMCTKVVATADNYQLRRAGFRPGDTCFFLTALTTMETNYDEFSWRNYRTMGNAHRVIMRDWDTLATGDVVDVEFELGESNTKKVSERIHQYA